jgi:hypothetical protein
VKDATDNEQEIEIDLEEIYWSYPPACAETPAAAAEETGRTPASTTTIPEAAPAAAATTQTAAPVAEATPSSDLTEATAADAPATAAPVAKAEPASQFHTAIAKIVARVEPAPLRELVGSTFARLLRVLDTLGVIEKALTRPQAVRVAFLFEDVRAQTASLLSHITETVSGDAQLDRDLRDVLDGMRFVIGHELAKVFRQEFAGINADAGAAYSRADLSRAWGLLHNCLQQTAITLAQAFSPGVTGPQLFEDYRAKVENSFTLYRELNSLRQKVRAAERSNGILLKHSLVRHMEYFREETMHFLMYKDWGEFGRYVDDVKRAFEEMEEFEHVLHEFSQYLSTLIHHVGMREVLRNEAPPASED